MWQMDQLARDLLQAVPKHRTVDLFQNVAPDFDDVVGTHTENRGIECGVVKLAERQSVRNDRLTARVAVGKDVSRVEKLTVTKSTDCAGAPICVQDTFTESSLVESPKRQDGHGAAPCL